MIPAPVRLSQARRRVHSVALHGVFSAAVVALASHGAMAQETLAREAGFVRVADRCSLYGAGFVDIGGGTCARVVRQYGEVASQHVRVDLNGRASDDPRAWSTGGTASAALRSDGIGMNMGMLPGAADARHLRVPGGLYGR